MRYHLTILILSISALSSIAQPADKNWLQEKMDKYRESHVQEKLYVSTDRQLYLTGELIWFKVFCVDASFHQPLNVSKVVYVELLTRNDEAVLQAKIEMNDGFGSGSFFVPTALSSDNYVLRAYTRWMRNFSSDFYFHKIISVVNPFVQLEQPSKTKVTQRLDFYPEGGTLINSVSTRIGYKITSSDVSARAYILDEKNDTLTRLRPVRGGVGSFELVPDVNKKYRALIKSKDGVLQKEFPLVQPSGYSMRLVDKNDFIDVSVKRLGEGMLSDEDLILFVHSRGRVISQIKKRTINNELTFSLEKKIFSEGVLDFTLFNEKQEPVCQRLFFKKPTVASSSIKLSESKVGQRIKNSFKVDPKAKVTCTSIAITRIDSLSTLVSPSMQSYLSLYSDLGSDLIADDWSEASAAEIDELMLTRRWRRFSWDEVLLKQSELKFIPESRACLLYAKVTDANGTPKKDVTVYLSSPGKVIRLYNKVSDANGDVAFELNELYGSNKIYLQTNRVTDSTSQIKLENPFSDQHSSIQIPELKLNATDLKRLLDRSVRMQAQNIFLRDFENDYKNSSTDSIPFYGVAEESYRLDDYTRFPIMEEVMREYVPGVVVRKKKDHFIFSVLDKKHNSLFREKPLILLDGVPIFEEDEIMQFDPLKVKRLDVVASRYFHGNQEWQGIVSYSTYGGDLAGFVIRSKNGVIDYEGLQRQRNFYSPSYITQGRSRMPDTRYLLYWNPDATIDLLEKEVSFFSSDVPGIYLIKLEGVSKDGIPFQSETTFKVTD